MANSRAKRWVFGTDVHGDQADQPTLAAFFEFVKFWKPEYRLHGGDAFDLRWLRGKASEGEKREKVTDDIDAGIDFIKKYKPTHFLFGNHDHRLVRAAESDDGKLADFATYLLTDIKEALGDAQIFPWDKRKGVCTLGRQNFLHGFHAGVYAARQCAMIFGDSCMGHVHASDQAATAGYPRRVGHTAGALCAIDMDYNRGSPNTLRQSNGWLYGLLFPNGECQVWHADKVAGVWVLPSEIREISGK